MTDPDKIMAMEPGMLVEWMGRDATRWETAYNLAISRSEWGDHRLAWLVKYVNATRSR